LFYCYCWEGYYATTSTASPRIGCSCSSYHHAQDFRLLPQRTTAPGIVDTFAFLCSYRRRFCFHCRLYHSIRPTWIGAPELIFIFHFFAPTLKIASPVVLSHYSIAAAAAIPDTATARPFQKQDNGRAALPAKQMLLLSNVKYLKRRYRY
jgi:hypothetical protein